MEQTPGTGLEEVIPLHCGLLLIESDLEKVRCCSSQGKRPGGPCGTVGRRTQGFSLTRHTCGLPSFPSPLHT